MSSAPDLMRFTEAFDLPPMVDLRTAARALGICSATAYKLNRAGDFPCRVQRIGNQYRIATSELIQVLGISDAPMYTIGPDTM